ncbi:MAG: hypothetical protein AAF492_24835, partial [Verrucomicrobiota bacterium]
MHYHHFTDTGGKVLLNGPTNFMTEAYFPGSISRYIFLNVPPGTYSASLSNPPVYKTRQPFNVTVRDWNAPGVLPTFDPNDSGYRWIVPLELTLLANGLQFQFVTFTNTFEAEMMTWSEDDMSYVSGSAPPPDFGEISLFGGRMMEANKIPDGITTRAHWDGIGSDDSWFTVNAGDTPRRIYVGGPMHSGGTRPSVTHAVEVHTVSWNTPTLGITGATVTDSFSNLTKGPTPTTFNNLTQPISISEATHPEWFRIGTIGDYEPLNLGNPLQPLFRLNVGMGKGITITGVVENAAEVGGAHTPITNASVRILNANGSRAFAQTIYRSGDEGRFQTPAVANDLPVYIDVHAPGFKRVRKRRTPDQATPRAGATAGQFEYKLTLQLDPLTPPGVVNDSAALNRFGAFLPGVKP